MALRAMGRLDLRARSTIAVGAVAAVMTGVAFVWFYDAAAKVC
jgi:hypothetical protein